MATEKSQQILDMIKELTIIELSDLVKAVEEEFGVSLPLLLQLQALPLQAAPAAEEKSRI